MDMKDLIDYMNSEITKAEWDMDAADRSSDSERWMWAKRKVTMLSEAVSILQTTGYTLNAYQKDAARTIAAGQNTTQHALYGMAAEVGELHGIYQKVYQGHLFDADHAKKELGDILWMVTEYATAMGWSLEEVAIANIDKLIERYPDGFDTERSIHRKENDV